MAAVDSVTNWLTVGATAPETTAPKAAAASKDVATKDTFLKLFVAQLKYQNPMNPADGTQFVSQLAQFTELEQLIGMRQNLESIQKSVDPADATGAAEKTEKSQN